MRLPVMPVANGLFPRPRGGVLTGLFADRYAARCFTRIGVGHDVLLCPWLAEPGGLYTVGMLTRIVDLWTESVMTPSGEHQVYLARVEGLEYARWHTLATAAGLMFTPDGEYLDLAMLRRDYPVITGAGWSVAGGYTEGRDASDIPVTIYGTDLVDGGEVSVTANLGGVVTPEQAHTIEHAVIRALHTYGICSVRTLLTCAAQESAELKQSIDLSLRWTLPEILGVTTGGACGNPMTNLAHFYLAREFVQRLQAGEHATEALRQARRAAMSHVTGELDLTMNSDYRVPQSLKKGMHHDDTALRVAQAKKVLARFPLSPWD